MQQKKKSIFFKVGNIKLAGGFGCRVSLPCRQKIIYQPRTIYPSKLSLKNKDKMTKKKNFFLEDFDRERMHTYKQWLGR